MLVITRASRDALRIGYQNRPQLFARHIVLPELLYERVIEVDERIGAHGAGADAARRDRPRAARCSRRSTPASARSRSCSCTATAITEHERRVGRDRARHRLHPGLGSPRGQPADEAGLARRHHGRRRLPLADPAPLRRAGGAASSADVRLLFMQSTGGLTDARLFQGKDAILSGPAGGIVGMVRTAQLAGFDKIIGFDMGGTSTDVSHFAGEFERAFETQVAGVRMRAPMMSIHTVAAGGGSILRFDGARFRVGPDSAGANPGPGLLPPRRAAHGDRRQRDARQDPAGVLPRGVRAATATSRSTPTSCARSSPRSPRRSRAATGAARTPGGGRRGLPRDRRREHGERDQADLGAARLRRHRVHAVLLRRRRRPARLPRRRRARHDPRAHPPARRRAVGLRHGPRRSCARCASRRSEAC